MVPGNAAALNLLARGAGVGLLMLLAGALLRRRPRAASARLGAAFALGVAIVSIADAPGLGAGPWRWPVAAVAATNLWVFWLYARAQLDDGFVARRWHLAVGLVLAGLGLARCSGRWPALDLALTAVALGLALLAAAQSAAAWREDLVEPRRRLRRVIVTAAAGYAALVGVVALLPGSSPGSAYSSAWHGVGLALVAGFVAWQVLDLRQDALGDLPPPGATPTDAPATTGEPVAAVAVAPGEPAAGDTAAPEADPALVARLDRLMAVDQAYREPDLGIGALAQRMGLPEHRLRRLINRGLGYRNFSAFLNGYRVAHAKAALADPARAQVPILSIAMEAGFQSIGPFNRAFKQSTGGTPSDYRKGRRGSAD